MTRYLLDTNILIAILRGNESLRAALLDRLAKRDALSICCVTAAEIEFGVRVRQRAAAESLLARFSFLPTTPEASTRAGRYMADLRARGRTPRLGDALIAGTARAFGAVLVTDDVKDFPMRDIRVLGSAAFVAQP